MNQTTKFKRLAERRFRQINPDLDEILITWEFVTDGYVPHKIGNGASMGGRFIARAEGHRPLMVVASMERGARDVSLR